MTDLQCSASTPLATNTRSSGRLREKSQRRFSLPSRREALESAVPDDETPFKNYRDYQPRKLVNNFVKERNRYNNPDGIELFDEFSDESFIDDDTSSDDDSAQEGVVQSKSSSDGTDDEHSGAATKPILRKTRNQRPASLDVRRSADSDSEEELARPLKTHKQRRRADLLSGSDGSETGSESSGDDLSLSVRKKKRQGKVPIQSDGSSDDDKDQSEASIPDPSGSSPDETGTLEEAKEQNCNGDGNAADKLNEGESGSESGESFIATSSSSDDSPDSENVSSDWDEPQSNKLSHEELICNYRQKKRRRTQSANKKKRRIQQAPSSDSGTASDGSPSGASSGSDASISERPLSKRAKRLRRKKDAWKTEVLGSYKNEREKKLSKKID